MSINYKLNFGTNLKSARLAANLSLRKFSILVGKSDTYLRQIESGAVSLPTEDTIRKIAEVLSLDADKIILSSGKLPQYVVEGMLQDSALFNEVKAKISANQEVVNYE